jgi:hypothetical protein
MDELTLEELAKWHAAQWRAALDSRRALGKRGLYMRLAEFHHLATTLLERTIRESNPKAVQDHR